MQHFLGTLLLNIEHRITSYNVCYTKLLRGDADALISGLTTSYPTTIRPALQCVGMKPGLKVVSGLYIVFAKQDVYFFADTTVNVNPSAEQLAEIAIFV